MELQDDGVGHEKENFIRSNGVSSNELDGAKTKAKVRPVYSMEFEIRVGVHQGSEQSPM